jgi:hypothetical protein
VYEFGMMEKLRLLHLKAHCGVLLRIGVICSLLATGFLVFMPRSIANTEGR